jgi:hypothetical protein
MKTNHQQRVMLSRKSKDLQELCENYAQNPELRNELLKSSNSIDFSNTKTSEVCSVAIPCLAVAVGAFVLGLVVSVGFLAGAWAVAACSVVGLPCAPSEQSMQAMADVVSYRNLV